MSLMSPCPTGCLKGLSCDGPLHQHPHPAGIGPYALSIAETPPGWGQRQGQGIAAGPGRSIKTWLGAPSEPCEGQCKTSCGFTQRQNLLEKVLAGF